MFAQYQPSSLKWPCGATREQINRILMKSRISTIAVPNDIGGTLNEISESITTLPSCGISPPPAAMVQTPGANMLLHLQKLHN